MEKMYSMNDTLKRGSKMSSPKRENMLYSMFNALNVMWNRVTKGPVSFMTGINYPLSVTVVHNEGIISHDFFKDLTIKRDTLNTDNVYIRNTSMKESLNMIENIHHNILEEQKLYVGGVFNEKTSIENLKFNYNYIDINNKVGEWSDEKEPVIKESSNHSSPTEVSNKKNIEGSFEHAYIDSTENVTNTYNYKYTNDTSTCEKEQSSDCTENRANDKVIINREPLLSTTNTDIESKQMVKETSACNILTNMWQKVYGNMTDRFYKTDSTETETVMKRSHSSPKQRRKYNTITKGRGRGRAKSQLRRSGVSQTRHRKERTKHDLAADIQNDLKNWQEEDCCSLDVDVVDGLDTSGIDNCPEAFTFADVEPTLQKPKSHKTCSQGMSKLSMRMRCIPECINNFNENFADSKYNSLRKSFRPRLASESSIDSEDSSCIVFETESEVTFRSDDEYTDESDTDETSDDDEDKNGTCNLNERVSPVPKVKFNLNPTVHVMVKWDYAYRAARRGPWEQMGRDRDRFKSRINCIGHVLNPILSTQHRLHIWQERFAPIE
ncbi:protein phosphatase 1 regulatory subunit 15 [Lasioglossum baleicum]|uniref:protein phosphatase 1 regulatory subunit 15 n=1 Tax=Lasioglossum baleicum TaxID=434251 RepID=UPI003FCED92B